MGEELAVPTPDLPGAFERRARTEGALLILDPETTEGEWREILVFLADIHQFSAWWLADCVNFGERAYGEKFAQAVNDTGLALSTLHNYASVGGRFPAEKRRKNLSFAHHAEVAYLEPSDRERWLDVAEESHFTRTELRQHILAERNGLPPPDQTCNHDYVCEHCGTHL